MKYIKKFTSFIFILALLCISCSVQAHHCGKYMSKEIKTYGKLSCKKAKAIYKAFNAGHIPKGWTCGQSVGGCGKGKNGFMFNSYH
jgi:hypothetical protein